jgi:5-oxoprolinase (ATP-hydrolysing)
MPPHSKELYQEGATILTFKLVEGGVFNQEGITKLLLNDPAQYPSCSGTRMLNDNLSDLKGNAPLSFTS